MFKIPYFLFKVKYFELNLLKQLLAFLKIKLFKDIQDDFDFNGLNIKEKTTIITFLLLFLSACSSWTNQPDFTWPVKPPHNLSRKHSIYHEGIDFPKATGEPVFSTEEGRVVYAGSEFSGYGKVIIIEHQYSWASLYAHLSKILVKNGSTVKKKEKIGEVGNTGRSSGAHLHFELIHKKQTVNPVPYLPEP